MLVEVLPEHVKDRVRGNLRAVGCDLEKGVTDLRAEKKRRIKENNSLHDRMEKEAKEEHEAKLRWAKINWLFKF